MSCQIIREDGEVTNVLAENGNPSQLYSSLRDFLDEKEALSIWTATQTPQFKEWFAGSKFIDSNGEPQLFFHGSKEQFDEFKANPHRYSTHQLDRDAFFFTDKRRIANQYGDHLYPIFLNAETIENHKYTGNVSLREFRERESEFINSADTDGVILDTLDKGGRQKQYVVFDVSQIRSAYNIIDSPVVFKQKGVDYQLKSIQILQSPKADEIFRKGDKNGWDLNKILTELAIPKEQKELLLELSATEKITKEVATTKHGTDEYRFSIGEFNKNKNSVRVAKNIEGDFSIHEGDLNELSKSQKVALFKAQSNVIPIGGQIVQRGGSSFDGIRHRINLQNHGFSIQYATDNLQEYKSNDINAVQEFANKYGLGKVIEKDGKLFTKGVILTKEKNDNIDLREQLALELMSNYGFSVEVNTAIEEDKSRSSSYIEDFILNGDVYSTVEMGDADFGGFDLPTKNGKVISEEEYKEAKNKYFKLNQVKTSYYSNLTVPGGTNYTENEIATPLITPSIKGHAQFATSNGIGWHRADDREISFEKLLELGEIKQVPC